MCDCCALTVSNKNKMVLMYIINHFTYQCLLPITFANSLDPVQASNNVRPDLYPNCCHSYGNPEGIFRKKKKDNFEKKLS